MLGPIVMKSTLGSVRDTTLGTFSGSMKLEREGGIEAYYSDMSGPRAELSEAAAAVAYELGARRMRAILDLPIDEQGSVSLDALAALPFSLRQRRRRRPVLLWELVAAYAGRTDSDADIEGIGRRHALAKAAIGMPLDADIIQQAKAWVRQSAGIKTREREAADVFLHEIETLDTSKQQLSQQTTDMAHLPEQRSSLWERLQAHAKTIHGSASIKSHPDSHELDDWNLYGPRSAKIFELVERLALEHDMRVFDIERIIEEALQGKLDQLESRPK